MPTTTLLIGILAIAIGLLACFAGYRVFRIVLPFLGFLVGMGIGAQLALTFLGEPPFGSLASWLVAIVVGLVAATIAFVWWYVSVALTIAGLGYAIGYGIAVGLGLDANAALVVGIVLAVVFGLAAVVLRIPTAVVIVVTAFWGASVAVGGVMVLIGQIEPGDLRNGSVDVMISRSPLYVAAWLVLAAIGIAVQTVTTRRAEVAGAEPVV